MLSGVLPAGGRRELQTWGAVATRCDLLDTGVALCPLFPGFVSAWMSHVRLWFTCNSFIVSAMW